MLELGQILGFLAAAVLIVAVAAWVKLGRRPALQRIDGRSPRANPAPAEFASQLVLAALGLSVVAALLAVVGWIGL